MTGRSNARPGARRQRDYTEGSLGRNIWLLAVPMVLEMGLVSLFRVADMFWVGKLGPEALAAITIGENVRWALSGMAMGQGIGGLAVVARRVGEKDDEAANHATLQAVLLALGITILISVTGFLLAEPLLLLLGTEPEVLPQARLCSVEPGCATIDRFGLPHRVPVDTVVYATRGPAARALTRKLLQRPDLDLHVVADAHEPRWMAEAIREGFAAGMAV